jgi:hypothetical protein
VAVLVGGGVGVCVSVGAGAVVQAVRRRVKRRMSLGFM